MVPGYRVAAELDLDLRLGLPVVVAPRTLTWNNLRQAAENGGEYVGQAADVTGTVDDAEQAATAFAAPAQLQLFEFVKPVVSASDPITTPAPDQQAGEEEEAAAEPRCKRAKSEPPQAVNCVPAPVLVQEKTDNQHMPAEQQEDVVVGVTEPEWIRADLQSRHGLPADLPLHFVECKALTTSDVNPNQNRLLVTSAGSTRLRALLSADEQQNCGLTSSGRRRRNNRRAAHGKKKKKRASPKTFPGVPVVVHERDVLRGASTLRLNTFHSTLAMVINGAGYREVVAGSGFKMGDCIEVWAFRRPRDRQLCLVIAKRRPV